jgi:hypothetical protein
MIADVSIRLLYLIFNQLPSSLTRLGRPSASRDIELVTKKWTYPTAPVAHPLTRRSPH